MTDPVLKSVLMTLLNKRIIGAKHTNEEQIIRSKIKWLNKREQKSFEQEYENLLKEGYLIRLKKRTGKGSDWHISLNPEKLKEIYELIR